MHLLNFKSDFYISLALIRVYCAIHIIDKLIQLAPYLGTLFGAGSWVVWSKAAFGTIPMAWLNQAYLPLFVAYFILSCLMLFGVGRNLTVIGVWTCLMLTQEMNGYILNGGDNLLRFVLFYLIFADSFRHFSISKTYGKPTVDDKDIRLLVHRLARVSMGLHLCLAYLISGIAKASSDVWQNGTALSYILQIERFDGGSFNHYLIAHPLVLNAACHFTTAWELAAPFLLWLPLIKWPTMLCGIFLHLGIFKCMLIHDFEILFISQYLIFINDADWNNLKLWLDWFREKLTSTVVQKGPGNDGAAV